MRVYQFRHIRADGQCSWSGRSAQRALRAPALRASSGFTLPEDLRDVAVRVDHDGRALDAHVRLAVGLSTQKPYCSASLWSASASSVNGRSYFRLNFACDASSSGLTPSTTAPASRSRPTRRGSRTPASCSRACRPWDRSRGRPVSRGAGRARASRRCRSRARSREPACLPPGPSEPPFVGPSRSSGYLGSGIGTAIVSCHRESRLSVSGWLRCRTGSADGHVARPRRSAKVAAPSSSSRTGRPRLLASPTSTACSARWPTRQRLSSGSRRQEDESSRSTSERFGPILPRAGSPAQCSGSSRSITVAQPRRGQRRRSVAPSNAECRHSRTCRGVQAAPRSEPRT